MIQHYYMKGLKLTLAVVVCVAAFAIAGTEDYRQEVLDSIPEKTYAEIRETLPEGATTDDVIDEYLKNREKYDNN